MGLSLGIGLGITSGGSSGPPTRLIVVGAVSADSSTVIGLSQTDALIVGAVSADSTAAATLTQTDPVVVTASSADSTTAITLTQTDPVVVGAASANSTTAITLTKFTQPTFRASAAGGGTSGTGDRSATITPAVGDWFLALCSVTDNTNDIPTCSDDNGGVYVVYHSESFGPGNIHRHCSFLRTTPLANTTSTVVTPATGSNSAGEVVVLAFSGMTKFGYSAVRGAATSGPTAGGSTPAATLGTALTGNITVVSVANLANPAGLTPPTNWTERQDVGQSTPSVGLEVATRDSGFTGTTVTYGSSSASAYTMLAYELDCSP